jgi:lipopolysaccharide/colanic/teichoic acid biosynthesis glycosyltransferase
LKRLIFQHSPWRRLLIPLIDIAIFSGALSLVLLLRQPSLLGIDTLISFVPTFALWLATLYTAGLYDLPNVRDFPSLIRSLLISSVFCTLLSVSYFYFFDPRVATGPKTILFLTVVLSHSLLLGWRRLLLWIVDYHLLRHRIAFLGDEESMQQLGKAALERRAETGFHTVSWSSEGADLVVADARWIEENWEEAKDILGAAIRAGIPVISLEAFYESLFGKVSPEYAGNPSWSVQFVLPKSQGLYPLCKRTIDIAFSAMLMTLLTPILALIYLAIRFLDRVDPIYGQRRVGFLGKEFLLYKFRTMRPGADQSAPFTQIPSPDGRVTLMGRWLRRFRLDELPQLYNVLRGEMSLVGPRPEWVKEVEVLEKEVPHYHLRHLVPPGITGWAQVYFRATNSPNDSIEKHHYDLYYLKYFSFALDFAILLKTIKRIFIADNRIPASRTVSPRIRGKLLPKAPDLSSVIFRN